MPSRVRHAHLASEPRALFQHVRSSGPVRVDDASRTAIGVCEMSRVIAEGDGSWWTREIVTGCCWSRTRVVIQDACREDRRGRAVFGVAFVRAVGEIVDEFAHSGKYDMYLQQAANVDKMIADLWYFVQTNSFYKNKTTFVITTDHGRGKLPTTWHKHGILTNGSGETWFAVLGPGISPEGEIKTGQQAYQKQMASTIAQLLGEQFESPRNKAQGIPIPRTIDYNLALMHAPPAVSK